MLQRRRPEIQAVHANAPANVFAIEGRISFRRSPFRGTQGTDTRLLEMWWCLTDEGFQRLTQSRGETSSSLTDDGLDDGGSL